MDLNSKELKSDSSLTQEMPKRKRNYSIKNSLNSHSVKNQQFSSNSRVSKEYIIPNNHLSKSSKKNKNNNVKEEKKEIKVMSSMVYQEKKYKNDIESLQKRHQKEIADIIKFELDKQLLQLKTNKEHEKLEKEYNNMNYKSVYGNNNLLLSLIEKEKEKEALENSKDKSKKKVNESKMSKFKDIDKNNNDKIIPPKPLKIIDEKNFHENYYLMEQAKKRQIYEMNQIRSQKRIEKMEKLNKIKADQNAIKKRIETERAIKNIQKNNYDLYVRKNIIEYHMQKRDLKTYQIKKDINEKREEAMKMNRKIEQEKYDYIRKLRLTEEKNRLSLYLDKVKKEKLLEKKKLENIEIKEKMFSQYRELSEIRNNNIKKLEKLIKNGIDEGNIQYFYSEFPDNKEIVNAFENYKKQKQEIELDSHRDNKKKKLNPLKSKNYNDNNDKMSKTSYDFKNKTMKMPKLMIDSIPNTKRNNDIDKEKNNELINNNNDENNNNKIETEKVEENENEKKEENKLINICATTKDKNNQNDEKLDNKNNENKQDNINQNIDKNENDKNKIESKNENHKVETNEKNENNNNINNLNNHKEEAEKENKNIFKEKKKVLFETEIREKIKEYKKERYQPFIKMLEREKINEENRNKQLENVNNEKEKKKLENQFGKERTLVSLRLKKENEKIMLDIQNFENKLREENEKNQKYNMDKINC